MSLRRHTLRGMLVGGSLFALPSLIQSVRIGDGITHHLGLVIFMTAIGVTVGGLIGPILGQVAEYRRQRRR